MDTTIQVRVDAQTRKKLALIAEKDRRTLSNFIRLLIEKAIEENNGRK